MNVGMNTTHLPSERVYNEAFAERGMADVVKLEVLPVQDGECLELVFEDAQSPWRQGVWMATDTFITVNGRDCGSITLWRDTAPEVVPMQCRTTGGLLYLYNVWDRGRGCECQAWTSGMLVKETDSGLRYRCNDIGFQTDFSRLVFQIRRTK